MCPARFLSVALLCFCGYCLSGAVCAWTTPSLPYELIDEIVLLTRAVRALGEGLVFCCLEISSAWWCRPGILALEKLRQDREFRVSLDYMVSSSLTPVHDLIPHLPENEND